MLCTAQLSVSILQYTGAHPGDLILNAVYMS